MKAGTGRLLGVIGALVLLAAACGGDDDDGEELSEDEFAEEFEEICVDAGDEIDEALADVDSPDDDEFPDAAEEAQEIAEDALGELEDINAPGDIDDDVQDLLDILDEQVDLIGDAAAAADDGDEDEANDVLDELGDLDGEFNDAAADLDIDCSGDDGGGDDDTDDDTDDSTDEFTDGDSDSPGVSRPVCNEVSSGDEIEIGDTVDESIDDEGDVVAFELAGDGSTVDIAADQADGSFDPVLTICDADGEELEDDDDGGGFPNAAIEGFDAEDGEDYLIVVYGFGDSTGDFELEVS